MHLLSGKTVQTFRHLREQEVARMIDKVSANYMSTTGSVDMTELLHSFSSNVVCRAVTGEVIEGNHYEKLDKMAQEITVVFPQFHFQDYFPWLAWLDVLLGSERRARKHSQRWDVVLDKVIDDHVDRVKGNGKEDFEDVLLSVNKDSEMDFTLSKNDMKALIVDIFAAGTDTEFITLEWAMAELIRNPHVLKKLQEEMRGIVTERRMVREEDLPNMVFLKAVIKEVMRIHPPVPLLIPRETTDECKLQDYCISKKTRVLVNAWAIGGDPNFWIEPEGFKPERFINSTVDYTGNHFQFIPFGAGRSLL